MKWVMLPHYHRVSPHATYGKKSVSGAMSDTRCEGTPTPLGQYAIRKCEEGCMIRRAVLQQCKRMETCNSPLIAAMCGHVVPHVLYSLVCTIR